MILIFLFIIKWLLRIIFVIGNKFARALFLSDLPGQLTDNVVAKLNNIDFNMVTSISCYSVDLISSELKNTQDEANELLEEVKTKNQKIFLMTFVLVHFCG